MCAKAQVSVLDPQIQKRKSEIREFSGWIFEEGTREKEWERAREFLGRFRGDALNSLLDILQLPRGAGPKVHYITCNLYPTLHQIYPFLISHISYPNTPHIPSKHPTWSLVAL